jgi:hypothetical protein
MGEEARVTQEIIMGLISLGIVTIIIGVLCAIGERKNR